MVLEPVTSYFCRVEGGGKIKKKSEIFILFPELGFKIINRPEEIK